MSRPGEVTPRAGADAEHGATAQLQRIAGAVPARTGGAELPPSVSNPSSPTGATQVRPAAEELNGGYDAALFAPTDRPDEPITDGMPFGAGSNWRPRPFEDDRAFMLRVADEIERSPEGTKLGAFVQDIRNGR